MNGLRELIITSTNAWIIGGFLLVALIALVWALGRYLNRKGSALADASEPTIWSLGIVREVYSRHLAWTTLATLLLAVLTSRRMFLSMRLYYPMGFAIGFSILSFFFMLFPFKVMFSQIGVLFSKRCRTFIRNRPLDTHVYRNTVCANLPEPTTTLTIKIPVYKEKFEVIQATIEKALIEAKNYGPLANVLICDDGLMAVEAGLREHITDVIWAIGGDSTAINVPNRYAERLKYYQSIIDRGETHFSVIGRPAHNRAGNFPKATNLMNAHRYVSGEIDSNARWHILGEPYIGDVILLLDKDSGTPKGVSRQVIPEFAADPTLSYVQCATVPSNNNENYLTKVIGHFTNLMFGLAFPLDALQGNIVPLVGHNVYIRHAHLRAVGYWREDRASEDLSLALELAAHGWHGKYADLPGYRFDEEVSNRCEEELGKYSRYAYGAAELLFNPMARWREEGLVSEQMRRFLRSRVPLTAKAALFIYLITYMTAVPMFLIGLLSGIVPLKPEAVLVPAAIFTVFGSLTYTLFRKFRSKEGVIAIVENNLKLAIPFGLLLSSAGFYLVRSLWWFFHGTNPKFSATRVGSMEHISIRQALRDRRASLMRTAVFACVFGLGIALGKWVYHWTNLELAVSYWVIVTALTSLYVMDPQLIYAFARGLLGVLPTGAGSRVAGAFHKDAFLRTLGRAMVIPLCTAIVSFGFVMSWDPLMMLKAHQLQGMFRPYTIQGVTYAPYNIGQEWTDEILWDDHLHDIDLLKEMGANAIKTDYPITSIKFLDKLAEAGIGAYVGMPFEDQRLMPQERKYDLFTGSYIQYARKFAHHPAIKEIVLTREENYAVKQKRSKLGTMEDLYRVINDANRAIKAEFPAMGVSVAFWQIPTQEAVNALEGITIGACVYQWDRSDLALQQFHRRKVDPKTKSRLYTYISEFGTDSRDSRVDREDEDMQARALFAIWRNAREVPLRDFRGIFIHGFKTDALYFKDTEVKDFGVPYDGKATEKDFGLVRADDQKKKAFYVLKAIWNHNTILGIPEALFTMTVEAGICALALVWLGVRIVNVFRVRITNAILKLFRGTPVIQREPVTQNEAVGQHESLLQSDPVMLRYSEAPRRMAS